MALRRRGIQARDNLTGGGPTDRSRLYQAEVDESSPLLYQACLTNETLQRLNLTFLPC